MPIPRVDRPRDTGQPRSQSMKPMSSDEESPMKQENQSPSVSKNPLSSECVRGPKSREQPVG